MGKISSGKDLLMLLLYVKGHKGETAEPISGKTRLMKMIFLFEKELKRRFNLGKAIDKSAFPDFEAHNFGPFSKDVYRDLDFLEELGFVRSTQNDLDELTEDEMEEAGYWEELGFEEEGDPPSYPTLFTLTGVGRSFVEETLLAALTDEQVIALEEFKARCTSVGLKSLLRYVYTKYPEYAVESIIKDQVF